MPVLWDFPRLLLAAEVQEAQEAEAEQARALTDAERLQEARRRWVLLARGLLRGEGQKRRATVVAERRATVEDMRASPIPVSRRAPQFSWGSSRRRLAWGGRHPRLKRSSEQIISCRGRLSHRTAATSVVLNELQ